VAGFAAPDPSDDPWRARAAASVGHLQQLQATTAATLQRTTATGRSELARQLELVAGLVEARVPTRVYSASLGGFDTHAGERGTQERLLGQVDAALSGFTRRIATSEAGRKVVVLVYSEFGRRVRANASDGTDHGTAGPVFVLGDAVRGGLYGEQPSLTDLDAGDLTATVDFRDVYAALAGDVLDADGGQVIPGHAGRLAVCSCAACSDPVPRVVGRRGPCDEENAWVLVTPAPSSRDANTSVVPPASGAEGSPARGGKGSVAC